MRDHTAPRLHVSRTLAAGVPVALEPQQVNYLLNVLRLGAGDHVLVFNGRDGEWRAAVVLRGKRGCELLPEVQVRAQEGGPDIDYLFAPLKRARLDYMVQKATELGVARLRPVITRRTIAERVNVERMRANVIEAAEQCGILRVPEVAEPVKLERVLADWDGARRLVLCDEAAAVASPLEALRGIGSGGSDPGDFTLAPARPLAVLIGPEGGFDPAERELLLRQPFTLAISLGPRIMRADTAAVAALALVNAVAGDWR
jgi:16S rRNA (uracil1498-N3)-methyltransferase